MQKAGAEGALEVAERHARSALPHGQSTPHGGRVVELFAGVGGFRIGLERAGWQVVLGNQWEPSTRVQHAFDCYDRHFGESGSEDVNEDIAAVLDAVDRGERTIPDYDLLVGGFPCQDYSVAKTPQSGPRHSGQEGRPLVADPPSDRDEPPAAGLPRERRSAAEVAGQSARPGLRHHAGLALGPGLRGRVACRQCGGLRASRNVGGGSSSSADATWTPKLARGADILYRTGVLARAFEVVQPPDEALLDGGASPDFFLRGDLVRLTESFDLGSRMSPFQNGGVMIDRAVWTRKRRA